MPVCFFYFLLKKSNTSELDFTLGMEAEEKEKNHVVLFVSFHANSVFKHWFSGFMEKHLGWHKESEPCTHYVQCELNSL